MQDVAPIEPSRPPYRRGHYSKRLPLGGFSHGVGRAGARPNEPAPLTWIHARARVIFRPIPATAATALCKSAAHAAWISSVVCCWLSADRSIQTEFAGMSAP